MTIGRLTTQRTMSQAITEIREWLTKIGINGLTIDTRYDATSNVALLRFNYNGQNYEFKSTKQKNCRLNMHGISRVMENKVRAHLMEIEDFGSSMKAYLQIENKTDYESVNPSKLDESNYAVLGISPLSSNDEIRVRYRQLIKGFHPDMANSKEAKEEFEKRASEINNAYSEIKKARGM